MILLSQISLISHRRHFLDFVLDVLLSIVHLIDFLIEFPCIYLVSTTTVLTEPMETTAMYMTSQVITTIVPTSISSALCVPTVSVVKSSVLTVSPTPLRPG